jgi:transcription termination factor NusB
MDFTHDKIEAMIYVIRGYRVMLDSDLAKLYGVETKRLKEQVKRNIERFPNDFLIQPDFSELAELRSQFATLAGVSVDNHVTKFTPYLFTENGVAMLSSVLKSSQAIQVNIAIMRTFTKMRSSIKDESNLEKRLDDLENETQSLFKIVFNKFEKIDNALSPYLSSQRKRIGLQPKKTTE